MTPEYRLVRHSNGDYELQKFNGPTQEWSTVPTIIEQEPLRDHESENGGFNK